MLCTCSCSSLQQCGVQTSICYFVTWWAQPYKTNHHPKHAAAFISRQEYFERKHTYNLSLKEQCVETQKPTPKSAQKWKNNHKILKCVTTANRDDALFCATTFCGAARARIVLHFNYKRLVLGSFHLSRLRASNPLLGALLGGSFAVRNAGHFSCHLWHLLLPVLHTLRLLHLPRRSFLFLNVSHVPFWYMRKPLLGWKQAGSKAMRS